VRRSIGGGSLQGSVLPALTSAPLSGNDDPLSGWPLAPPTLTGTEKRKKTRLQFDHHFSAALQPRKRLRKSWIQSAVRRPVYCKLIPRLWTDDTKKQSEGLSDKKNKLEQKLKRLAAEQARVLNVVLIY